MFAEDKEATSFLKDETVKSKFAKAKKISEVQVKDYDAIFYVGGHGPVLDLASDPVNARLASEVNRSSHLRPYVIFNSTVLANWQDRIGRLPWTSVSRLHYTFNNKLTF
jgi:hypothetical protein